VAVARITQQRAAIQREVERDIPVASAQPDKCRALAGLLVRKQRWGLSWSGRLLVLFVVSASMLSVFFNLYSILAVTHRVDANILVVEGWVHEYAIRSAAEEFRAGSYKRVFTTGGPVVGLGGYINDFQTAAGVGADELKKAGISSEFIQMVPSHTIGRDRTYSSALALREWLNQHDADVHSINVLTEDVHARRTQFLFGKAFGRKVAIGIIPVTNPDYDAKHWWRYSEGVKDVLSEGSAYIYARFLFHP
jgi:DUF218 domain